MLYTLTGNDAGKASLLGQGDIVPQTSDLPVGVKDDQRQQPK